MSTIHSSTSATARTPDVAAVLDAVRSTGRSAHPAPGQRVSDLVMAVAVGRGLNPVELQAAVFAYSYALAQKG